MDTNESTRNDGADNLIKLGAASIETKGPAGIHEFVGTLMVPGISEE
ncbi:benenodin family lasso peptide [Luteimonas soli]|uniref:Benenodin family lasso peptide n=1 Tax=Luteimonas soli TaxID=1648966 RepID=A0ABV7XK34_9GAMM